MNLAQNLTLKESLREIKEEKRKYPLLYAIFACMVRTSIAPKSCFDTGRNNAAVYVSFALQTIPS